jgi:hypothetical protein
MIRYVCDMCGQTADETLPPTWTLVQVMARSSDPGVPVPPSVRHVCEAHDAKAIISSTPPA